AEVVTSALIVGLPFMLFNLLVP
ncbi:MAG: hypothetical protein RL202_713, partial [Actinomycetota bacterium]